MTRVPQPAAATEDELRDQCDHVCLKDSQHVWRGEPHFYGYRGGPHSREGLQRELDRLRKGIERLATGRCDCDVSHLGGHDFGCWSRVETVDRDDLWALLEHEEIPATESTDG